MSIINILFLGQTTLNKSGTNSAQITQHQQHFGTISKLITPNHLDRLTDWCCTWCCIEHLHILCIACFTAFNAKSTAYFITTLLSFWEKCPSYSIAKCCFYAIKAAICFLCASKSGPQREKVERTNWFSIKCWRRCKCKNERWLYIIGKLY